MNKYILILLGVWLLTACSEDKGNYDYHAINEVKVGGTADQSVEVLEANKWYTKVAFVDHLTFDPLIESTFGQDQEANYEYEWRMLPYGDDFNDIENKEFTIATTRKIDLPLTMTPDEYACFFIVKDKKTGVSWTTPFYLRLKSMTGEGWMVLCEENNQSRMDVIFNSSANQDLVAYNIWKDEEFHPGKPLRLVNNNYKTETIPMLVTDKDTYVLDKFDMHAGEDNSLKWRFGSVPASIEVKASANSMFAVNNRWVIVDGNNDLYSLDRTVDRGVFEFNINLIDGKTPFKAAPFVGVSYDDDYSSGGYGCAPAVVYDQTHQQFLIVRNNATYPSPMKFSGSQLFSPQTGRDMVFMESTKPGMIYALLKDPTDGAFYFYGMKLKAHYEEPENWWEEGAYEEYNVQEYYGKLNGTALENANLFAFHHTLPYLFYSDGQSIYQFDMGHPDEPAKLVLRYPNEEIKVLRFNPFTAWLPYEDWERARGYRLIVGTHVKDVEESKCGIMRMYDVPNLMGDLVLKKEHKNLGKIVDIAYKERIK